MDEGMRRDMRMDTPEPEMKMNVPVDIPPREQALIQAINIITKNRNVEYGGPEDSFSTIAGLWTAYTRGVYSFDPSDVAILLALVKVARLAVNPQHADSWVDLAGYAACGYEVSGAQ